MIKSLNREINLPSGVGVHPSAPFEKWIQPPTDIQPQSPVAMQAGAFLKSK